MSPLEGAWLWLFPFPYLVHILEESFAGERFYVWIRRVIRRSLSPRMFLTLNALFIVRYDGGHRRAARRPRAMAAARAWDHHHPERPWSRGGDDRHPPLLARAAIRHAAQDAPWDRRPSRPRPACWGSAHGSWVLPPGARQRGGQPARVHLEPKKLRTVHHPAVRHPLRVR